MDKIKKMGLVAFLMFGFFFFAPSAHAETRWVRFHLDNSLAGSTFFHQNVIVKNLFDAVPSQNGAQSWEDYSTRRLRVNDGTTVKVTGAFYYRNIFGGVKIGYFTRDVYVPRGAVTVTVK